MFNWFKKNKITESNNENGPDYSNIDSIPKAIELYNKGELAKIHLMPLEFGGEDSAVNVLYFPEFVEIFKQQFDKIIEKLLMDGKNLNYTAQPEYKGKSFIPSKLKISVTGDSDFEEVINIWQ